MTNKFTAAMSSLEDEVSKDPLWLPFAEYYRLRAQGLRNRAQLVAEQFAESALNWPFDERKRFALWLMDRTGWVVDLCGLSKFAPRYSTGGTGMFAPRNVDELLLRPTLFQWAQKEPDKAEPRFWIAMYDGNFWGNINEALRIDPIFGPACAAKIEVMLAAVRYNQHELPSGYLDDPSEDLRCLSVAEALLDRVDDAGLRATMRSDTATLQAAAEDWIRLREELRGLDWESRSRIWQDRQKRPSQEPQLKHG